LAGIVAQEFIDQIQRSDDPRQLVEAFVALLAKCRRNVKDARKVMGEKRFLEKWGAAGAAAPGRMLEVILQAYQSDLRDDAQERGEDASENAADGAAEGTANGAADADAAYLISHLPVSEMLRKSVGYIMDRRLADAWIVIKALPELSEEDYGALAEAYWQIRYPKGMIDTVQLARSKGTGVFKHGTLSALGALGYIQTGEVDGALRYLRDALAFEAGLLTEGGAGAISLLARNGAFKEVQGLLEPYQNRWEENAIVLAETAKSMARMDLASAEELIKSFLSVLQTIAGQTVRLRDPRVLPEETAGVIQREAAAGLERCLGLTRLFEAWHHPEREPVKLRILLLGILAAVGGSSSGDAVEAIVWVDNGLVTYALRSILESEIAVGGVKVVAGAQQDAEGNQLLRFTIQGAPEVAPESWPAEVGRRILAELNIRPKRDLVEPGVEWQFVLPENSGHADDGADDKGAVDKAVALVLETIEKERYYAAEILSFLVHDLKNGFSFILQWAGEVATGKHPLVLIQERIDENIVRMNGYIDESLKYLALQESEMVDLFSLEEVLHEVARSLGGACAAQGVQLKLQVETGLPSYRGQRDRILSILFNLAKNSLEAMRSAGHAGELTFSAAQDPSGEFVISIKDSGPGMTPAAQERLFQLGDKPERGSGRGIGLWTVRRYLEREGGSLSINPGQEGAGGGAGTAAVCGAGTVFRIMLPGTTVGVLADDRLEQESAQAWRASGELAVMPEVPWDTVFYLMKRAIQSESASLFNLPDQRSRLTATALRLIDLSAKGSRRGKVLPSLVQHVTARFSWLGNQAEIEEGLRKVLRAVLDDNLERELEDFRSLAIWLLVFGRDYAVGGIAVEALVRPEGWNEDRLVTLARRLYEYQVLATGEGSGVGAGLGAEAGAVDGAMDEADLYQRLRLAATAILTMLIGQ
jgi:signal transduction histidine kinase